MMDLLTLPDFAAQLKTIMGRPMDVSLPETEFNRLALALFALQFRHNPAYAHLCQRRGMTPDNVFDWRAIPPAPTAAFKELELTCVPASERAHEFHSSGTTAQRPSRHYHPADSLALYEASLAPWFEHHLLPAAGDGVGDRPGMIFLTPPPEQAPHSSLAYMLETIRQRFASSDSIFCGQAQPDGAWALDLDRLLYALRKTMCANRPVLLLGTAFNFVHLLDHFDTNNIRYRLAEGSHVMETGGYKGRSREMPKVELHAEITKRLGIAANHIVCEYGMCELSSQAYDSRAGQGSPARCFRFPPWARVRIISPEDGRELPEGTPGLVCIYDLANAWSVLAVQTEDLGIKRGDGFELLGRAKAAEVRGCSLLPA